MYRSKKRNPWVGWLAHTLLIAMLVGVWLPHTLSAQPNQGNEALYHGRAADPHGDTSQAMASSSLFTGAAKMRIPIAIPPGTGGVQPNLSVSYNSRRHGGNAGIGWFIGLPKIARSTHYGSDEAVNWSATEAVYDYGGDELIRGTAQETDLFGCNATRYYREVERFERILFCEGQDYWTITQRDGAVLSFGRLTTNNTKLIRPSEPTHTMEYYLAEVRDTRDLLWEAHYSAYGDPNAESGPRLEKIEYTFLEGVQTNPVGEKRVVDLEWEPRPDSTPETVSMKYGFQLATDHRLAAVKVALGEGAGEQRVRRYVFTYGDSPDSNRSQLAQVQMFGTTDNESLPAMDLEYQWTFPPPGESDPGFESTYLDFYDYGGFGLQDQAGTGKLEKETFDVDGDGYVDLVDATAWTAQDPNWDVWFGTGSGFASQPTGYPAHVPYLRNTQYDAGGPQPVYDVVVELVDMDADGLKDIFTGDTLYWNRGDGFTTIPWSSPYGGPIRDVEVISVSGGGRDPLELTTGKVADLLDVTGDGCPDQVVVEPYGFDWQWRVYRNQACDPTPVWGFSSVGVSLWLDSPAHLSRDVSYSDNEVYSRAWTDSAFVDFNGDGIEDHFNGEGWANILLGTGKGFTDETTTTYATDLMWIWMNEIDVPIPQHQSSSPLSFSFGDGGTLLGLMDINGDQLVDIVESDLDPLGTWQSSHPGEWRVWLNTGRGFQRNHERWTTNSEAANGGITRGHGLYETKTLDFDGDGRIDWVHVPNSGTIRVYFGDSKHPDLLSSVKNGTGAENRLTYAGVVGGDGGAVGSESMPAGNLHFSVPVVTKILTTPGMGSAVLSTDFVYWTPYFDRQQRRFNGFTSSRSTAPILWARLRTTPGTTSP